MKLVRSGSNTLRISLTSEDLIKLQVQLDDFDYDLPGGKRVIGELFERARQETGFHVEEEKVYIQLYPKGDGGCELFVIKLEEEEKEQECFLFSSFEAFSAAWELLPEKKSISGYRFPSSEQYLILAPLLLVPPQVWEYGEKMKNPPSTLFLKTKCRRIPNRKET